MGINLKQIAEENKKKQEEEYNKNYTKVGTLNISKVTQEEEKPWYQQIIKGSEAFNDGYQFGDVTKTVGATAADIGLNIGEGVTRIGESAGNLILGGIAQVNEWTGNKEEAERKRKYIASQESKVVSNVWNKVENKVDTYSLSAKYGDEVFSGIGYTLGLAAGAEALGAMTGTASVGSATVEGGKIVAGTGIAANGGNLSLAVGGHVLNIPTLAAVGGMAGGLEEAYSKDNVTSSQAWAKAVSSGAIEGITEGIFGMFGVGGNDVTDSLKKSLVDRTKTGFGKVLTNRVVSGLGEASEELMSYIANSVMDKVIDNFSNGKGAKFSDEKELGQIFEEVGSEMGIAFLSAAITGGGDTKINENALISQVEKQTGLKLTEQQKQNVINQANQQLNANTKDSIISNSQNQLSQLETNKTNIQNELTTKNEQRVALEEKLAKSNDVEEVAETNRQLESLKNEITELENAVTNIDSQAERVKSNAINQIESLEQVKLPTLNNKSQLKMNYLESMKAVDEIAMQNAQAKGLQYTPLVNNENLRKFGIVASNFDIEAQYNIEAFENLPDVPAYYDVKADKIMLNPIYAYNKGFISKAMHELVGHAAIARDSSILTDIKSYFGDDAINQRISEIASKYEGKYSQNYNENMTEEAVVSLIEENIGNEEFLNRLAKENTSILKKLYKNVCDIVDAFKKNGLTGVKEYISEYKFWESVKTKIEKAFENNGYVAKNGEVKFATNEDLYYNTTDSDFIALMSAEPEKVKYTKYSMLKEWLNKPLSELERISKMLSNDSMIKSNKGLNESEYIDVDGKTVYDYKISNNNEYNFYVNEMYEYEEGDKKRYEQEKRNDSSPAISNELQGRRIESNSSILLQNNEASRYNDSISRRQYEEWFDKKRNKRKSESNQNDLKFSINNEELDNSSFNLVQDAKNTMGTTDNMRIAGYLTADGEFIDFSGKYQGSDGKSRQMDHRDITEIYSDKLYDAAEKKYPNMGSATAVMQDFIDRGNIRTTGTGVDIGIEPTQYQYNKLYDYLEYLQKENGEVFVDLETESKNRENLEYNSKTSISKIINDIKEHFSSKMYSISDEDNQGRKLTKEQQDFFKDSKIKTPNNELRVMYHGTPNEFTIFDRSKANPNGGHGSGFYFTTSKDHASDYNGKIGEYYLNITNPLNYSYSNQYGKTDTKQISNEQLATLTKDMFNNEDYSMENYGYGKTTESIVNDLYKKNSDYEILMDLNTTAVGDMTKFVEYVNNTIGTNYDGILTDYETIAFYPNQIKRVDNLNPTSNEDIRYSINENLENELPFDLTDEQREYLNTTNITKLNENVVSQITKNMKEALSLNRTQTEEFRQMLIDLENRENISKGELKDIITNKFSEKTYSVRNDEIASIKQELRNTPIKISQQVKDSMTDYVVFKTKNFGKLNLTNSGQSLDSVYQELSNNYPQIFSKDIISEENQLKELARVANLNINEKNTAYLDEGTINKASDYIFETLEEYNNQSNRITPTNNNAFETPLNQEKIDNNKSYLYEASTTPNLPIVNRNTVGDGESHFANNIENKMGMLNDTSKETLLSNDDVKFYDKVTNKDALEKAYKKLTNNGVKETTSWFNKDSTNATDVDVAEGFILLKQYQDRVMNAADDLERYNANQSMIEVAKKMREIGTKAGQTVQAFNILERLTPEGMAYYAQSELQEAYDNMIKGQTKEWIDNHREDFELTPDETQAIMDKALEIQYITDEYQKKVKIAEIQKIVTDKLPPQKGTAIKAWMRISMLCNPKTQVRNVAGNALIMPINSFGDMFASYADKIVAKKTGVRTTGTTDVKSILRGFKRGAYTATNDYVKGINTKDIQGNRFEIGNGKSFTEKTMIGKSLNVTENLLNYVMDVGDRVFSEAAFENSLQNQMKLNHTTEATAEMIDIARQEALQRTWNDNNGYTRAVLNIRSSLNSAKVFGYGLGDVLIPFAKTPANLTKAIVDYSPAGLVNAIVEGNKLNRSISTGQFTAQQQHKFVQDLGKGVAGSMLYVLGYALAKAGISSGKSDDDKDAANFLKNTLGISSYSIKIGNKSFTYDWAQPLAAPLSIMANIVSSEDSGTALLESIVANLDTAGSILLDQSFMQSINDVLTDNSGVVSGIINELLELPARAIPTFSKQIADLVDGTQRQTYVYKNPVQSGINSIKAKLPGISTTLAPSVDTMGRDIQKFGGKNNIFNVFFNPANVNTENISEAAQEIYDVYKETADNTVMPRVAPSYVGTGENKVILTNEQKAEWNRISGNLIEESINKTKNTSSYKNLSDVDKAAVINDIVNYAYNYAQSKVLNKDLSTTYTKASNYISKGGNIGDYYIYKLNASNMISDKDSNGKTISGSLKTKKVNYINSMNISVALKLYLIEQEGYSIKNYHVTNGKVVLD